MVWIWVNGKTEWTFLGTKLTSSCNCVLFCSKPQLFWTSSDRVFQSLEVICVWQIVVRSDLCLPNRSWKWFVSDKSESLDWWRVFQSLSIVWLKFAWLRVTANKICAIVLSFTSVFPILQILLQKSYWKPKRFYFANNKTNTPSTDHVHFPRRYLHWIRVSRLSTNYIMRQQWRHKSANEVASRRQRGTLYVGLYDILS